MEGIFQRGEGFFSCGGSELAFPHGNGVPSHSCKLFALFKVAGFVAFYLCLPEFGVGLWHDEAVAVLMSMPEAAVDEDDCPVFAHDDVGMSRQARMVQAIAESMTEEIAAHNHLRLGVPAMYR